MENLKQQYEFIVSSRKVLLEYCEGISEAHFLHKNPTFGNASIQYLLLHNANCYKFWIESEALQQHVDFLDYEKEYTFSEIRKIYEDINNFMKLFMETEFETEIPFETRTGIKGTASKLKLFTHVTTHEFHHKGQILSMSRHLGYTPVDTDIMR
ncbi:MAG: DinB family protein [Flavobacteriaceae bacterium]|nr:DinB family protein [Flavobacteriaceae bacterium]